MPTAARKAEEVEAGGVEGAAQPMNDPWDDLKEEGVLDGTGVEEAVEVDEGSPAPDDVTKS